jgi:hypothetical protein
MQGATYSGTLLKAQSQRGCERVFQGEGSVAVLYAQGRVHTSQDAVGHRAGISIERT